MYPNQRFSAGGISPQIQAMIAAQVAQQMAQQQYMRPGFMVAGEADIIGAADFDPDAAALLAGLDASAVGLDDAQIAGELISGDPDLVGADLISGADYEVDAESGAIRPRTPVRFMPRRPVRGMVRRPGLNMAPLARDVRMAKALQAQPVIADRPYTRTRTLPAPFDSGSEIAANGSAVISLIPNAPYKAEFLVIPDDVATDFVITTLMFGRVNGLASAAELPANTYAETAAAELNRFDVPMVPPGIPIQIGVRNTSGAARRFRGRFQGKIVES